MTNFDFSGWHKGCSGVNVVSGPAGELHVYCPVCQVVANLEAISAKITPEHACLTKAEERIPQGDQSNFVKKGVVVK